jgi:hypothetical protein
MTNQNELPLYLKLYQFTKLLYGAVHNFPKEYKYTIGREMIDLSWRCLDLVIEANALPNNLKYDRINQLGADFEKLKMRIRMSQEIEAVTIGQYVHWQTNFIDPIGKMANGWKKWAK